MRLSLVAAVVWCASVSADELNLRVLPNDQLPTDSRLSELRTLNSDFPLTEVATPKAWQKRRQEIRDRILVSQGLWPAPPKWPLNAVIHGRRNFDGYSVEKVFFESIPGHFVTGSLYRPLKTQGPVPAILCPHGHWQDARFYDAGEAAARRLIASGAERFVSAARNHIQARCVQLARMGCVVFFYDMTGYSDSIQLPHRHAANDHLDRPSDWGYFSVQADLRLQNMMGLQTWNSIRCVDFLTQLPDVDITRIGVTGASGGGTQSMLISAVDDRIAAAMPCVMVSTSMQGGCTCENAPYLRIRQGNIDIAAVTAPRPLGLTAADDWTRELKTRGFPELQKLYRMLNAEDRLTAVFHTQFPHNYNHVNRTVMYGFFNRHFRLGHTEPVLERDFQRLTRDELTVWNKEHPAPSGTQVGDPHEIRLLQLLTDSTDRQMRDLLPDNPDSESAFAEVIGTGWKVILGRTLKDVNHVRFEKIRETSLPNASVSLGLINNSDFQEQLPVAIWSPRGQSHSQGRTTVWISDTGKSGALIDGKLHPDIATLLQRGHRVITADLSGQGEFTEDGKPVKAQRMWYQGRGRQTWERFCGYTYGYNDPLFVQRTHDVLTLIRFAASDDSRNVYLVGHGKTAGPIVLAARTQAGPAVAHVVADLDNFEFAKLKRHDDPMFVPGALRYLGVAGLASLNAPFETTIAGLPDTEPAARMFRARKAEQKLRLAPHINVPAILP